MVCLRTELPEVQAQLDKYTSILGSEDAAYYVLSENNGYDLDKAPNGQPSKLFSDLLSHFQGDENAAILAKSKVFTKGFKMRSEDSITLDENEEPTIDSYYATADRTLQSPSTNPELWNLEDRIVEAREQFESISGLRKQNKLVRKTVRMGGKNQTVQFYGRQGFPTREQAQRYAKQIGLHEVTIAEEDHGSYYLRLMTKDEFQKLMDQLSEYRNYLSQNQSANNETTDPTLKDRLFNGKDSITVGAMLTKLAHDNPNHLPVIRMLQRGLSSAIKSHKIVLTDFSSDPLIPTGNRYASGLYIHQTGEIFINSVASFKGKDKKADLTILHEIIHAATHNAISQDPRLKKDMSDMLEYARKQLANKFGVTYQQLLEKYPNVFYGLTDTDEFLAELTTNASFARELMSIPAMDNKSINMIDAFVQWLMKAFGITNKDDLYSQVYTDLSNIILNEQYYNEVEFSAPIYNLDSIQSLDETLFSENISITVSANRAAEDVDGLVELYNKMDADIEFDEDKHTYTNKHTGQVYKSVSDVKTSIGYGEQEDKLPKEAIELGNFTKKIGTNIHQVLHEMLLNKFDANLHPDLSSKVISQIRGIADSIRKKYSIIASEQVLYNDEYGIAGTADLIVQDKKTKKVIILDFKSKVRNIGDVKKSGFSYYRSSKYGRPDVDKHNFQLSMYERLHELAGFSLDERGIVPIEYDCTDDGTITSVYITSNDKGSTLEDKGYYTIPHRSQIDADITNYVFNNNSETVDQIQIDRQQSIVNKILDTTRNRVVTLFSKGKNTQATDVENTLSEFNSLSEQEIILSYIESALNNLKSIIEGRNGYNEKLSQSREKGAEVWNLKQLESWRDVARSYSLLEDIQSYLFDYSDILPEGTCEKIMPILDDAVRYRDILEGAYKTKGKELWIRWITPFIKNIEGAYRVRAEKQYKQDHPGKIDNAQMQAYIEKYIADNRTKIELETRNFINQQSIMADQDVNGFYRWVDTIFQTKDPIISGMAMAYDQMAQQTNETFNEKYNQLVELTREMEKAFGTSIISDPRKVYDYMLEEVDGEIKLISEIPESFIKAYRNIMNEIDADPQYKSGLDRFKARMKWLDDNAPIKDRKAYMQAKLEAIEEYLNSIDISQEEFDTIMANERKNSKKRKSYYELAKEGVISFKRADDLRELVQQTTYKYRVFDKTKFPNKKWEDLQKLRETDPNNIKVRFFDFIKSLADEGDARVAPRYRLNGRLPGVRKTSMERMAGGQSALKTAKETIGDTFSIQADDTMYGQFDLTDESNRPINYVPVFYTGKVRAEDQSFDIPNIYKMWFKSALSYANTVEILDQLEYTKFIVNERQTKTGTTSYATKVWKRMHPDSSISDSWSVKDSSNLANQLNDWFDMIVYGKGQDRMGTIESPFFGKIDLGKVVNLFAKYTSLRVMGLNYISMVNNSAQAEVAQMIETFSKQYVTPASYTRATGEYLFNLPDVLGDVGLRAPRSKINLLNQLFMTFADYDRGNMRLSNRFSRLFNSGAFYFTTNVGEHEAQSRFLIAMLMDKRALDKDGNDIGSIYDFYTVEDGKLVFDKDGIVSNWSNEDRRQISARVRSLLMSMHGNYSEKDKVALQRNGYLKLALMFRKWIVPSARKRFDALYYDNILQDYREGYYRTGGRFFANNVKRFFYKLTDESKAAELAITADWHNLTEQEKANVRRFSTEIAITTSLFVLYSLVKGWADDEDDLLLENLAYQLYRLRTDMGFYYNPRDAFKIIQSPFPSTSAVKSVSNLIDQVMDPFERYEQGSWKGRLKLEKRVYDMLPIVRQLYRARDIENEFKILNMK